MRLETKKAIVTGAGGGIGRAVSEALAQQGVQAQGEGSGVREQASRQTIGQQRRPPGSSAGETGGGHSPQ